MVTQFLTLSPRQAIEIIEAAGVKDAPRLISDHVAAGLVKSYAQVQTTITANGERASVRGGAVAAIVWERMIRDDVCCDAWDGGTVRLAGSDLIGGELAMQITGLSFNPADIDRLAGQQRPARQQSTMRRREAVEAVGHQPVAGAGVLPAPMERRPDPKAIPDGALLATVKQAEAALGFGRTKINELMNDGTLARVKVGGATRIEVASIRAFACR
jgi:hypothetical protein